MRRWRKSWHKSWAHALIVGVLLAGETHLFTVEFFHHHDEVARVCQIEHRGGPYLHAAPELSPLCPLCQVVRTGSVRPAVVTTVQKLEEKSACQPTAWRARYSAPFVPSLLARAPPLS